MTNEITKERKDAIRGIADRLKKQGEVGIIEAASLPDFEIVSFDEAARSLYSLLDALDAAETKLATGEPMAFTVMPMSTAPHGDDALEPAEIEVHEGSWAVVVGTNGKPVGWIDTHAAFDGRTYRDQLLAAPPAAEPVIPEGWVLVPREPTEAMIEAAEDADCNGQLSDRGQFVGAGYDETYRAMLAAVPSLVSEKEAE